MIGGLISDKSYYNARSKYSLNATRQVGTNVLYNIRMFKRIGEKAVTVITNFYIH